MAYANDPSDPANMSPEERLVILVWSWLLWHNGQVVRVLPDELPCLPEQTSEASQQP